MKKVISIILISAMMLSVVACGGGTTARETADSQASVTKETMKDVKSDIPFQWSFISNDGSREVYEVKVDKGYSPDTNFDYSVWYGKEGAPQSFMVKMKCSLAELKEGVQVGVPLGQVALLQDNNVAGVLRITEVDTNSGDGIQVASQVDEQDNKQEAVHEKQPKDEPSRNDENKDQNNGQQEEQNNLKTKAEKIAKSFGEEYVLLISSDNQYIGLPQYAAPDVTYKELAKMYLGDENFRYIVNPKTDLDHYNNIQYITLTGHINYVPKDAYELANDPNCEWDATFEALSSSFLEYCAQESALLGYFTNTSNHEAFVYIDDTYYYATNKIKQNELITPEKMHQEIIDVYLFAKEKYTEFRASGKIKDSSTEYEIAKVYSDWFRLKPIITPYNTEPTRDEIGRGRNYISAYSSLFETVSLCGGRCAAFIALMKIEGITAHGLSNGHSPSERRGHIVPWLLLDGKEYIFEHNMGLGLQPVDKEHECSVIGEAHYFQQYSYNQILKREGLEYNPYYDDKPYTDKNGCAITKEQCEAMH